MAPQPAVSLRIAIIDIASGGWMTRGKRTLHTLRSAYSRIGIQQLLVTNRRVDMLTPLISAAL